MAPEHVLLASLSAITVLVVGWEAWRRRRVRRIPTCPHCGSRLRSVEPGRRRCDTCQIYFRRVG